MSSKTHFEESSKFSGSREKIDAQSARSQQIEESLEDGDDSQNDYRKSLAWDSAFFTSPGVLEPEELFETLNFRSLKSAEQERINGVFLDNSRRSLAWDNAFFTSDGVLDPEELSLLNKGFKGSRRYPVPETVSTVKSDGGYSLASLEVDLLGDLKASFENSSKTAKVPYSSAKMRRGNCSQDFQKSDVSPRGKMRSMPDSKKKSHSSNRASERTGKAPSQSRNVARAGNCTPPSSLKPPKASVKGSPASTDIRKRVSSGTKPTKMENKAIKAASGHHLNESPSSGWRTPTNESAKLAFTFSHQAAGSTPSSGTSGSPSPFSNTSRNECDVLNSSLPSHLLSSFKSFCISPAGSVDLSSSEPHASVNQISDKTIRSLDTTPSKENSFDLDTTHQNQQVNAKAKGSRSALKNVSRNTRPSGLRMPSPKLGFFDAENPLALTPNGGLKFHLGADCGPKPGSVNGNKNGAANRPVPSKTETGNMKLGSVRNRARFRSSESEPALLKEDKGTQGSATNRKSMKPEGHDYLRSKKQKHDRSNSSRKVLNILGDDDNENLCSSRNLVDGLTKHLEAADFLKAEN